MKKGFLVFLTLLILLPTNAQGPYRLNWKKEALLFGASGLLISNMIFADPAKTTLTEEEVALLDPADVNAFDRRATQNYSEHAAYLSDFGLYGTAIAASGMPLLLPAISSQKENFGKEFGTLGIIWMETNLLNLGLTELAKTSFKRIRPYAYHPDAPMDEKLDSDVRKSFFSGHTSIAAANTFFMARVYADYYPESRWKPLTWGLAAAIPVWTGYMRYKAGKHFPTDVITGYAIGAAFGYFIPLLHKIQPENERISMLIMPYNPSRARGLTFLVSLK